ncbi:acyltransferase [Acinetobacter baumannii]|uniref:acyltransferase n=1 Tax=Acinetobacter baumannii TaxID=470 RepID=UPI0034CD981E
MEKERIIWLDYVRCFACLSVVLLHAIAPYTSANTQLFINGIHPFKGYWIAANTIDSFTRMCVPLFFMLSGYFFFSDRNVKVKNFIKLIVSLIFYSALCVISVKLMSYATNNVVTVPSYGFFDKPAFYHLWFFYVLIPIYFIAGIIKVRKENLLYILAIATLIFTLLNPSMNVITKKIFNIDIRNKFMLDGNFIFYLSYAFIGGALSHINIINKNRVFTISLIMFLTSALLMGYLTMNETINQGKLYTGYRAYVSPLVAICSISFMIMLMSLSGRLKRIKIIELISILSLPIYGVHAVILYSLRKIYNYQTLNFYTSTVMVFLFTITVSILLSLIIKKIDRNNFIS